MAERLHLQNGVVRTADSFGRASEREVVLARDLRAAFERLNPELSGSDREQAIQKLSRLDFVSFLVQPNREVYHFICEGVRVEWRDALDEMFRGAALSAVEWAQDANRK